MIASSASLAALVAPLLMLALGLFACAALLLLWAPPGPHARDHRRPRQAGTGPRRTTIPRVAPVSSPLRVAVLSCAANGHCVLRWAELIPPAGRRTTDDSRQTTDDRL